MIATNIRIASSSRNIGEIGLGLIIDLYTPALNVILNNENHRHIAFLPASFDERQASRYSRNYEQHRFGHWRNRFTAMIDGCDQLVVISGCDALLPGVAYIKFLRRLAP
jgi:hypothetical protein